MPIAHGSIRREFMRMFAASPQLAWTRDPHEKVSTALGAAECKRKEV
jgi:hypothetical protein